MQALHQPASELPRRRRRLLPPQPPQLPPPPPLCRAAPGLAVPPRDYSSEAARVAFLSALGSSFHASTQIRLNLRRLYRAGGSAARELHRLAVALRAASQAVAAAPPPPKGPPDTAAMRQQMDQALGSARQQAAQLEQRVGVAGQEVQVLEGERGFGMQAARSGDGWHAALHCSVVPCCAVFWTAAAGQACTHLHYLGWLVSPVWACMRLSTIRPPSRPGGEAACGA